MKLCSLLDVSDLQPLPHGTKADDGDTGGLVAQVASAAVLAVLAGGVVYCLAKPVWRASRAFFRAVANGVNKIRGRGSASSQANPLGADFHEAIGPFSGDLELQEM